MVSKNKKNSKEYPDVFDGPLRERRYGLRIDDEVEIQYIAGNELKTIRGRLLEFKNDIELVDEEGYYHQIIYDWVVDIKVIKHNRPPPSEDQELLSMKKPKKGGKKSPPPPPDQAYF
ncbi:MAG: hypothetical protein J7L88_04275 [Thermoplasmata archaeon]|nr:hypothetical protein [Thermoplasmata archaeon]